MYRVSGLCLAGLIAVGLCASAASAAKKESKKVPATLNFTMDNLDGKPVELSKYQGKVVLMVNVASKCGYTKQYKELEALHEKYAKDGLVILGFPANNFGKQEPGTNEEIAQFCSAKFGVKFDMFSKVSVTGEDECPLYRFLTSKETNPTFAGPVKWNFEKFLINREGKVVARYRSAKKPDDPEVVKSIETELNKK